MDFGELQGEFRVRLLPSQHLLFRTKVYGKTMQKKMQAGHFAHNKYNLKL